MLRTARAARTSRAARPELLPALRPTIGPSKRPPSRPAVLTIVLASLVAAAPAALAALAALAPGAAPQSNPPRGQPSGSATHVSPAAAPGGQMTGQPTAAPADVASPDAVLAAFYESISGPPGKKRDWNRFLSLFFAGARLLPAEGRGHAGTMPEVFSPESYLYNTEPYMLKAGYIEKEIARRSVRFGKIVQVWSSYRVRHADSDPKPFVRGINSFQLFFDGSRWWIFSLVWQPETPQATLPDEFLR
ncbi:MAG TPA: hypothetical protein VHR45_23545 [Thermoanaerobaculia bacterium]|nr:hypothetical protein [Thermoanaerobaculia bacterium]